MKRLTPTTCVAVWILAACGGSPRATNEAAAPPAATPAAAVDAEFERVKAITPVDACTWLSADKLKTVFPELSFAVHQKLEPRMSGYAWDSRCTYWAGVGSVEFAKDVPTHTLDFFLRTVATDAKANANLASRRESASSATGYEAQTALGPNAYSTANTGVVSLFFVHGQHEVQINFSDLKTPTAKKIEKAIAVARTLS